MHENNLNRDYLKSEMDYRLNRIQSDISGRRLRRSLTRRWGTGDSTFTTAR